MTKQKTFPPLAREASLPSVDARLLQSQLPTFKRDPTDNTNVDIVLTVSHPYLPHRLF